MNKRMLQRIAALTLCLTMAAHGFGWLSPAYAAGGTTVYTFGNAEGAEKSRAETGRAGEKGFEEGRTGSAGAREAGQSRQGRRGKEGR